MKLAVFRCVPWAIAKKRLPCARRKLKWYCLAVQLQNQRVCRVDIRSVDVGTIRGADGRQYVRRSWTFSSLLMLLPVIHRAACAQGKPFIAVGAMRDCRKLSADAERYRRTVQRGERTSWRSGRAPAATDARPSAGRIRSIAASSRYLRASSLIRKMIASASIHYKSRCRYGGKPQGYPSVRRRL
jgi:hypothetical protein